MGREVLPSKSESGTSGNSRIWEKDWEVARTKVGLNGEVEAESNADLEKFRETRPSQIIGAFEGARGPKGGIGLAVDKKKEEKSEKSGNFEVNIVERSGRRDWFVMTSLSEVYIDLGDPDFLHASVSG
jgi:hypothetical protein